MSEYEYDKNKPAASGEAPVEGAGVQDNTMSPPVQPPASGDAWAEQDEWSLRSTSVEEDDPLLKLARLMQQNERDFAAAAAPMDSVPEPQPAPPVDAASAPVQAPTTPYQPAEPAFEPVPAPVTATAAPSMADPASNQAFMRSEGAAPAPAAPHFEEDDEWHEAPVTAEPAQQYAPEPAPIPSPTVTPTPSAPTEPTQNPDLTVAEAIEAKRAQEAAQRAEELRAAEQARYEAEMAERARLDAENAQRQAAEQAQLAAAAQATAGVEQPFAPELAAPQEPSEASDFDVSRMPRAIRPPVSLETELGGLHGRASDDILAVTAAPHSPAELPTAESVPAPSAVDDVVPAASLTPAAPDYSYLRDVDDLRAPALPGDPAAARETPQAAPLQAPPAVAAQPMPSAIAPANSTLSEPSPAPTADVPVVHAGPEPQAAPGDSFEAYDEEDDGGLFASKGMLVAAGVLAILILGGGSLMIYQAIFGGGSDGPPPLIQADGTPIRITPDGQATSDSGIIALTESGTPQDGQLRPSAEQPLNLNPTLDPGRQTRIIPINPNDNAQNGGGLGPRPVTTFTVRPDGSIVTNGGDGAGGNTGGTVQPRSVSTQPIGQNGQVITPPSAAGREVRSRPVPRPRPGGSAPIALPASAGGGRAALPATPSVSVAPRVPSGNVSAGQAAPRFSTAAPAVQPAVSAPRVQTQPIPSTTQPSAAPTTSAAISGDFVVQVSSQRSENAAQSSYADLQRRFPSVLGNQPPNIVRADLGSRGVFYRVRVGPMQTRGEAAQFCQRLQAAGGDCIVARR